MKHFFFFELIIKSVWSWAFGIVNTLMICFIFIRNAYTHAHLPVCSNLLSEPENYSVVSDYRSPVWQPHFSGTLKVTTVEQMAQFPQPFRNNKTLLQRNANLQMCFFKQDRERRWKETCLSVFLGTNITYFALVLPSSMQYFPFITEALLTLLLGSELVCGTSAQFGARAMMQSSGVSQLPVSCTLVSLLCYMGHHLAQKLKVKYLGGRNSDHIE